MTSSIKAGILGLVGLTVILAAAGRLSGSEMQTALCALVALERVIPPRTR